MTRESILLAAWWSDGSNTIRWWLLHNDFIATRNCRKNWVATWNYILSKRPTQYCLFYDYKRCVSSNLSIISPKISISISNKYTNDWKIGWYTPLKIIKQAILVWSFRQNTFPGCYPVFPAISSGDAVIVLQSRQYVGWWAGLAPTAPHKKGHFMKFMLMVIWVLIEPCDGVIVST